MVFVFFELLIAENQWKPGGTWLLSAEVIPRWTAARERQANWMRKRKTYLSENP